MTRALALFCLLALGCAAHASTVIIRGPMPASGLNLVETFNPTGFDLAGWTTSGTINADSNTLTMEGAQNLATNSTNANATLAFTAFSEVWASCWFNFTADYTSSASFVELRNSSGTAILQVNLNNTNTVTLTAGGGTTAASSVTLTNSTTYRVWMHWVSGGTCEVWISTDGTARPASVDGSGVVYLSRTGASDTAGQFHARRTTLGGTLRWDYVKISTTAINSANP